jgi:hypothetical protein
MLERYKAKLLAHDAALRLTLAQQAQEIERSKQREKECHDTYLRIIEALEVLNDRPEVKPLSSWDKIAWLTQQLATMQADVAAACGELMVSLEESPPGSLVARLVIANRVLRSNLAAMTAERDEAVNDEGCSMAARTDLGHGKDGYCTIRNRPCPTKCLLKQIGSLEATVNSHSININAMNDVYSEQLAAAQARVSQFESIPFDDDGTPFAAASAWRAECNRLQATLTARDFAWSEELSKAMPGLSFMSFVGPESTARWIGTQFAAREARITELEGDFVIVNEQRKAAMQEAGRLRARLAELEGDA